MSEVRVSKAQPVARHDGAEIARPGEGIAPMFPLGRIFGMSPIALMREFTDEMDRVFRGRGNASEAGIWSPTIDMQQCNGTFVISAELPGLKREDVKVELTDDVLIIEGERKREHQEDHEGFHRWERSYGHFYRSLPLPEGARADQAKAELKDGVLKVSIPVPETKKKLRQVPIEEAAKSGPTM